MSTGGGSKYVAKDVVISGSLIDLSDVEVSWNSIDKRVRTSIRKGERMNVSIRRFDSVTDIDRVRPITPNDDDIPTEWTDRFFGFVAETQDARELLGWILFATIPGTSKVFMLCHASTPRGKEFQTPNLLLWHAVKSLAGSSYRYFDVGASYRPSLQKYFSGYQQKSYPIILRAPDLPVDLRITPFDTQAYGMPSGSIQRARERLSGVFGTDRWTFFPRAMYAISAVLREYHSEGRLQASSEVLISTTTESSYISRCVTQAIECVCAWSRTVSEKTAVVFLIHEFGFPNPRAAELRAFCSQRGIPLIEDLAYGFGSEGTGIWGDVRIVSATKIFPVQAGGFLVGMQIPFDRVWSLHQTADIAKEEEILSQIDAHWESIPDIRVKRREAWKRYQETLQELSIPFFALPDGVMPGAYLARMPSEAEMKRVSSFVKTFGIEVGNWYYHDAIFLPCHQRLTNRHVDFISGAIHACFRENCGVPHPPMSL